MNAKQARRAVVVLAASLFLLACNCNTIQAILATPTPTATVTPTPAPTPTPTLTPTSTPPPTNTSGAILTLADLPSGYEEIPPEDMGLNPQDYLSTFAFMDIANFEIIYGFNSLYESSSELAGFTLAVENPDLMMEALSAGMGLSPTDMETFPVPGIGESSVGIGAVGNMEGIMMRMEIVMFLRGNVGSTLLLLYQADETASVSIVDLALLWDQRLIAEGR